MSYLGDEEPLLGGGNKWINALALLGATFQDYSAARNGRQGQALLGVQRMMQGEKQQMQQRQAQALLGQAATLMTGKPAETVTYGSGEDATTIDWKPQAPNRNAAISLLAGNPLTAGKALDLMPKPVEGKYEEIYDPVTGRKQKGWAVGANFTPMGGVAAPDVGTGMEYRNGQAAALPGYGEAAAGIAGMKTEAERAAALPYEIEAARSKPMVVGQGDSIVVPGGGPLSAPPPAPSGGTTTTVRPPEPMSFAPDLDMKIGMLEEKYNLPPGSYRSLVQAESGGRPGVVSPKGAVGYAQVMPGTAKDLGIDPNNPDQNLEGGARYLRQQLDKFGNLGHAYVAYNWGPGNADMWVKSGADPARLPPETRAYLAKNAGINAAPTQPVRVAQADTGTMTDAGPGAPPAASGPQVIYQGNPANKPPTVEQARAGGFANRMVEAEKRVAGLEGFDPTNLKDGIASKSPIGSNYMVSSQWQLYRQAADDWARAKLRKESGAVISPEESDAEFKNYWPQPGDGPAVIAQKKAARETAMQSVIGESGNGYNAAAGTKVPDTGGSKPPPTETTKTIGSKTYVNVGGQWYERP